MQQQEKPSEEPKRQLKRQQSGQYGHFGRLPSPDIEVVKQVPGEALVGYHLVYKSHPISVDISIFHLNEIMLSLHPGKQTVCATYKERALCVYKGNHTKGGQDLWLFWRTL